MRIGKSYIEDPYHGQIHGIFKIIRKCDDGLFEVVCTKCGKTFYKKYKELFTNNAPTHCLHNPIVYIKNIKNKRIYNIFKGMVRRCYEKGYKDYRWYGDKGIKICDDWMNNPSKFESWALANGYKDDLTIDRIDSNGDYYPENCRWVTMEENSRRAAEKYFFTVNGITLNGKQWSDKLGVEKSAVTRIYRKHGAEYANEYIKRKLIGENKYKRLNKSIFITVDDVTLNGKQWANVLNLDDSTINYVRRKHGLDYTINYIREKLKNQDTKS